MQRALQTRVFDDRNTRQRADVSGALTLSNIILDVFWLLERYIFHRFASQLQAALEAQGNSGFDIILDAVSGEYFMPGFEALALGGRYVVYGAANWTPTGIRHAVFKSWWQMYTLLMALNVFPGQFKYVAASNVVVDSGRGKLLLGN